MSDDRPRLCMRITAARRRATTGARAGSYASALMSLTIVAPRSSAHSATSALYVSIERGTATRPRSPSRTGSTRWISSSADSGAAPGRVDSPPMSMMSAPAAAMSSAAAIATSASRRRPSSANESGVTFRIPITKVRGPRSSVRPSGSGTENDGRGAITSPPREGPERNAGGVSWPLLLRDRLSKRRDDGLPVGLTALRLSSERCEDRRHGGGILEREALREALDLIGVEHLAGEQLVGNPQQDRLVVDQDLLGAGVVLHHEAFRLLVNPDRRFFAVVLMLGDLAAEEDLFFALAERQGSERIAHAPFAHHLARQLRGLLDVIAGAGRHLAVRDFLGDAAAHEHGEAVGQPVARVVEFVLLGQLQRHAERHPAGNDRDLVDRIRVRQHRRDERVARLVDGRDLLLFVGHDHRPALRAHHDLVLRVLEVGHAYDALVVAGRVERRLVHQIGDVGPAEARRAACEHPKVDVIGQGNLLGVDHQNPFAALDVGTVHDDAAVEATGAKEGRVEHIGPVRGRDQDHAFVRLEPVHLDEELVQRLLPLVVPAAEARAAMAADRIDFVDEDDARGVLLALFEEVAHARRADTDEHLDEIRSADREERHVGFAGNRARQQRLARAGGSDEEHPLRNTAAEPLELLRLTQELDDLLELLLRLVCAGDVLERDLFLRGRRELRAALAERQGLVPAALHLPHDENPEADHQEDRRPVQQDRRPGARALGLRVNRDGAVGGLRGQIADQVLVVRRGRRIGHEGRRQHLVRRILRSAGDLIAAERDVLNLARLNFGDEIGQRDLFGRALKGRGKLPDRDNQYDDAEPDEQALQRRVHKSMIFNNTTPDSGLVTRNSSARAYPATHTIRPVSSTTMGTRSRSSRGTFRSTSTSCTLRRPGAPSGRSRSPGRRLRTRRPPPRASPWTAAAGPRPFGQIRAPAKSATSATRRTPASGTFTDPGTGNGRSKLLSARPRRPAARVNTTCSGVKSTAVPGTSRCPFTVSAADRARMTSIWRAATPATLTRSRPARTTRRATAGARPASSLRSSRTATPSNKTIFRAASIAASSSTASSSRISAANRVKAVTPPRARRSMAGSRSCRMALRGIDRSAFDESSHHVSPRARRSALSIARGTSSSGRTRQPRRGWMPPAPRAPLPRSSRSSTVSAWSSAVCAVATLAARRRAAAAVKNASRASCAVASMDRCATRASAAMSRRATSTARPNRSPRARTK